MIPGDTEFDVIVSEGVLVEVWRGEIVSVAQEFGVDWDGPAHSMLHAEALRAADPAAKDGAANASRSRSWRVWVRRSILVLAIAWLLWAVASASIWMSRMW